MYKRQIKKGNMLMFFLVLRHLKGRRLVKKFVVWNMVLRFIITIMADQDALGWRVTLIFGKIVILLYIHDIMPMFIWGRTIKAYFIPANVRGLLG